VFIGVNGRYKDKRVDKVLHDLGFEKYEIFYSPMAVSMTNILMFLWAGGSFFFFILYQWLLISTIATGVYLCVFLSGFCL
jgi:hypothetical protein